MEKCEARFAEFVNAHGASLHEQSGHNAADFTKLFRWAYSMVGTRCIANPALPCDIAMVPVVDLLNHSPAHEQSEFFLTDEVLRSKLIEREIDQSTNARLEEDHFAQKSGWK